MPRHQKSDSERVEEESRRRKLSRQEESRATELATGEVATPSATAADPVALLTSPQVDHPANAALKASILSDLQQQYGNAYVQRVIGGVKGDGEVESARDVEWESAHQPPRGVAPLKGRADGFRLTNLDDGVGMSFELTATLDNEETGTPEPAPEEERGVEREAEPVVLPPEGAVGLEDPVNSEIGVFYTIGRGGVTLGGAFGMATRTVRWTTWARQRTLPGGGGTSYDVRVRTAARYRWDVGPGENGRKHTSGPRDRDVAEDTWSQMVYDLTPSSAVPCRSPRKEYWCRDLTARHERFHIEDWVSQFRADRPVAQAWLNGQSASSLAEAMSKTDDAIELMILLVDLYMGSGSSAPCEVRAYDDGAPAYRARAQAVQERAATEGWAPGLVIM